MYMGNKFRHTETGAPANARVEHTHTHTKFNDKTFTKWIPFLDQSDKGKTSEYRFITI